MSLTQQHSFEDITSLREVMNQLYDETFTVRTPRRKRSNGARTTYRLPVDVYETIDEFVVQASVPGVAEGDIDVEFEDSNLVVSGEFPARRHKSATYHIREGLRGYFERTLTFPTEIATEEIEATLENGILTILLPKTAAAQPRKIPVTAKS